MLIPGALVFIVIWLLFVTFYLYRTRLHYARLTSATKKKKLDEILDALLERDRVFTKEIDTIKKSLDKTIEEGAHHFQKIGFLRFNPFERVGGEQSFIIALLDKENSGIILNFLYTREGVRVYTKKVKGGKSEEYELSAEEKEAIKKAV